MSTSQALPEPPEEDDNLPEVPLGWKPTPRDPVPVVRCVQVKKNGDRCKRWSIRGYDKCMSHAGPGARMADGNVNKYAAAVIEAARLRLVEQSDMALDVIEALYSNPGTAENVRLKAATEILDRAGIRGGIEINVDMEVHDSPVDEIKRRIADLRKGSSTVAKMKSDNEDVVDAEIVEEDTPLFELEDDQ